MKYSKIKIVNHLYKALILSIIITSSSCGFQGRKYTIGHYWDGRNQMEYEKQSGSGSGSESEKVEQCAIASRLASEEKLSSKIDEINSAVEIIEEQKLTPSPSRSQTNHLINNTKDDSPRTIETPDEIERETVPLALLNKHKSINRQIIWGLVISSFSFDIFIAIIGLGINEPELIYIPIIALCILPFFLVPHLKKLKLSIDKFKQELEGYKSTNAEKKWFKREKNYLENIDLLHGTMIALSISFLLLSLLMINAVFAGG